MSKCVKDVRCRARRRQFQKASKVFACRTKIAIDPSPEREKNLSPLTDKQTSRARRRRELEHFV